MASKASAPENENLLAGLYEAIRALDRRVVVGIAVACGFILVAVCACCIKVLTRKRQGVYASAEKSLEQGRKKDEEEREEILADVYGRSSPGAEDDLGEDDAALKKAWQVIEGDQSSDDDNVLVPARDAEDFFGPGPGDAEEIFLKQLRAGSATTGAEKGARDDVGDRAAKMQRDGLEAQGAEVHSLHHLCSQVARGVGQHSRPPPI
ncbi:unnamed protein product [Prorocentrum cordatum]|uniref:Transmembrane protein n=1 Tax=Prorocentrum cordatum TaxID=2364126 RepID=A0ABN9WWN2_9DINO|nr:unnamed protein product [Polarella glacialis]